MQSCPPMYGMSLNPSAGSYSPVLSSLSANDIYSGSPSMPPLAFGPFHLRFPPMPTNMANPFQDTSVAGKASIFSTPYYYGKEVPVLGSFIFAHLALAIKKLALHVPFQKLSQHEILVSYKLPAQDEIGGSKQMKAWDVSFGLQT